MLQKTLSYLICLNLLLTPMIATAEELNGAFDDRNQQQFTDEELAAAKNFQHGAKENRILTEQCKGTKCDKDKADLNASVLGGSVGVIVEQNIGKLYAAIFGAGGALISAITSAIGSTGGGAGSSASSLAGLGGDGKTLSSWTVVKDSNGKTVRGKAGSQAQASLKAKEGNKKQIAKGKEVTGKAEDGTDLKTEQKTDWCSKIAIASEVSAAINQHIKQKKIASMTVTDPQRGAIDMARLTHEERRVTSLIQAGGFTGVAACYGVMMFTNSVVVDRMMVIKMASASALASIFYIKANKHKKARNELERIANLLPKAGDCNPYTDTACFCAEATSSMAYPAEFAKVCVASEYGPKATASSQTCLVLNKEGKYIADTACKCKLSNSCFTANLKILNPKFSLASNMMNQGQDVLNASLTGNLDEGKLNSAMLKSAAYNQRVLAAADKKVGTTKTAASDKALADELSKSLPPNIAAQLASGPTGEVPAMSSASPSSLATTPEAQEAIDAVSKKASYASGGPGFGSNQAASDDYAAPKIPSFGETQSASSGTEVISFAEQAVENADISKAPETPIFDIISYRYRQSAWNKVDVKIEDTPAPVAAP